MRAMVNPYVFSMTSRMVTIVAACTLLLCALLFLLGVQIGARYFSQPAPVASSAAAPTAASSSSSNP
ncbi:hypothetical protein C7402_104422 [Paraburkholderia unamae]|uniref:Uncharacterized protein n=2 Tax=Paraburkholderia unamae TaxID=219649 RepID=A0ABX5KWF7_9BURK|nr:hypothetical protein C7402_104422 [Paraburkholderia unamae]RAR65732.1 hypothetical protein C7401_10338 [Paraburkholderia unamae]